jgi:hypothetical protein
LLHQPLLNAGNAGNLSYLGGKSPLVIAKILPKFTTFAIPARGQNQNFLIQDRGKVKVETGSLGGLQTAKKAMVCQGGF